MLAVQYEQGQRFKDFRLACFVFQNSACLSCKCKLGLGRTRVATFYIHKFLQPTLNMYSMPRAYKTTLYMRIHSCNPCTVRYNIVVNQKEADKYV